MKLLEEVEINLDFADLSNRQPLVRPGNSNGKPPARAPGIHLSGILRHVLYTSRMPRWQQYAAELEAPVKYPLIWFMGVIWEEGVASLYPSWVWQPGETAYQGISMNMDGINVLDDYGPCIEEAKYTSCKRKTGDEFMQDWLKMQQGKGYCVASGYRLVRWHVCWNQQPWAPVYCRYLVEFDERDVDETEKMLMANKQGAVDAGYAE